jgi:hypothetical protein
LPRIEQAIYGSQDAGGYRFLARSAGFADAWLSLAEKLCAGFGERPSGVSCPFAVFAQPFGAGRVAVVQVADQGFDDAGRPGALAFRLLVLPRRLYADLAGDPFLVSDQYPPAWEARGELPELEWTAGPPPRRTVADVRKVLDVAPERTQTLLGGAQVLVDGGRLVFERKAPDPGIVRELWALLPDATRAELWPASFAFGNRHGFQVLVTPDATGADLEHYVREQAAGDYPEGRYEYAVQKAAEDGDQAELDTLFARRSRGQMLRLALVLLVAFVVIPPLVLRSPVRERPAEPPAKKQQEGKAEAAKLPPPEEFHALDAKEREGMADRLGKLAGRLGVALPAGSSEEALRRAVVELDRRIDERLGEKKPARDPGPLDGYGPAQRRLRALLWKHGAPEYATPGLNPAELVERLEKQLARRGLVKEDDGD